MKFLIQTINKKIEHEFAFTLLKAIEFNNWLKPNSIKFKLTDEKLFPNYIPIGSIEFVENYLLTYFNIKLKPLNIPDSINHYKFTRRNVINGTEKDIYGKKFVKSNDIIKFKINDVDFTGIYDENNIKDIPQGNYQISDVIDIQSEWRAFVYENKLVGLQNYLGDFTIFPDINLIKEMIIEYNDAPIAYSLDVGVNYQHTFIIECHRFYSTGFYGFADLRNIPFMFSKAFYEMLKIIKR
jgi:hypothetical protein